MPNKESNFEQNTKMLYSIISDFSYTNAWKLCVLYLHSSE